MRGWPFDTAAFTTIWLPTFPIPDLCLRPGYFAFDHVLLKWLEGSRLCSGASFPTSYVGDKKFLASAWSTPNHCVHLRNEPVDTRSICSSQIMSLLFFKWMSEKILKHNCSLKLNMISQNETEKLKNKTLKDTNKKIPNNQNMHINKLKNKKELSFECELFPFPKCI